MAQEVVVDGKWKICTYKNAEMCFSETRRFSLSELEIGYDGYNRTYNIFIEYNGSKSNLEVVRKSMPNDGDNISGNTYLYEGRDRIGGSKVMVTSGKKLGDYVSGKGLTHRNARIEDGIMIMFIQNQHVISIIPYVDSPKRSLTREELKRIEERKKIEKQIEEQKRKEKQEQDSLWLEKMSFYLLVGQGLDPSGEMSKTEALILKQVNKYNIYCYNDDGYKDYRGDVYTKLEETPLYEHILETYTCEGYVTKDGEIKLTVLNGDVIEFLDKKINKMKFVSEFGSLKMFQIPNNYDRLYFTFDSDHGYERGRGKFFLEITKKELKYFTIKEKNWAPNEKITYQESDIPKIIMNGIYKEFSDLKKGIYCVEYQYSDNQLLELRISKCYRNGSRSFNDFVPSETLIDKKFNFETRVLENKL